MFVIKYDKRSMVRLVKAIEKQPAIYDTKNLSSKEDLDSAWDKVAAEVGEKDSLCRDRWHSIKSCYIRHLKYTALNTTRKPYYLAEYLDFLLPHVSDRIRAYLASKRFELDRLPSYLREALPKSEPTVTYFDCDITTQNNLTDTFNQQNHVIKEEIVDVEEVSDSDWLSITPEIVQKPSSSKEVTKRLPNKPITSASSPKKMKTLKVNNPSKSKSTEDDDIKFFKTLLPEVARMSSHQKLKFKQEALSIIEDILYATEDVEDLNIMD